MSAIETIDLPATLPSSFGDAKYDREFAAFRRLLPSLMRTHPGQFVAIHDEQVIACGVDRLQVVNEALGKIGNVAIHVGLVGPDSGPTSRSGLLRDLSTEAPKA